MSRGPYHIPAWEGLMLARVARCMTQEARERALEEYVAERERRRRHATVRDERDRERRTLVGAHVPRAEAEQVAWIADQEDMSVTAFVRLALRQAVERSDTGRELSIGGSNCNKK